MCLKFKFPTVFSEKTVLFCGSGAVNLQKLFLGGFHGSRGRCWRLRPPGLNGKPQTLHLAVGRGLRINMSRPVAHVGTSAAIVQESRSDRQSEYAGLKPAPITPCLGLGHCAGGWDPPRAASLASRRNRPAVLSWGSQYRHAMALSRMRRHQAVLRGVTSGPQQPDTDRNLHASSENPVLGARPCQRVNGGH